MENVHEDELTELRRRIYGPHRDLADDPKAMARLAALEAGETPPTSTARSHAAPELDASSRVVNTSTPPAARRGERRLAMLWAASLIVAVAGSSATTWWLLRDPGTAAGVIELGPSTAVLPFEPVDGGQVLSGEFHGLTVAKLPKNADVAQLDDDCLSITPVSIYPDATGVYGCGAGGAPASVPMNVTEDAPDELRDEFPVGTTLVFTLDDESVRVRSISE